MLDRPSCIPKDSKCYNANRATQLARSLQRTIQTRRHPRSWIRSFRLQWCRTFDAELRRIREAETDGSLFESKVPWKCLLTLQQGTLSSVYFLSYLKRRGNMAQPWTTTAPTYSSNVGRTSALSASRLLEFADRLAPITNKSLVLDVGAGTGAVAFALASRFSNTKIIATDISASMLENISAAKFPNVQTRVLDARHLSTEFEKGIFSHVCNTFMLQSITTPLDALREMDAVLAPGGVVGVAIWAKRNGPFEIWEAACKRIEPGYELPAPFEDPRAWRTQGEL